MTLVKPDVTGVNCGEGYPGKLEEETVAKSVCLGGFVSFPPAAFGRNTLSSSQVCGNG